MNPSQIPVLIPVTYLFASLVAVLSGQIERKLAYWSALAGAALAFCFSLLGLNLALKTGKLSYHLAGWMPPLGIEFILDPLSAFICAVISAITLGVMVYSYRIVVHETPDKILPFYSLTMILLTGLSGMVMTGDLFNLYVFLEIASLGGYALVAVGDKRACVSAFRYLTMGTAGASFYLLGVGVIYISTGSLNMVDVSRMLPLVQHSHSVVIGLSLIVVGIGLKMALFPMHGWLPDAYTHASSAATALIAPIGTKVAAYVLIRIMFYVADPHLVRHDLPLVHVVGYLGALGILWGSIMAICQKELKRMLAFSSVAQVGYIALGIGLASPMGFIGAVLHIVNHACMKGCLFLVSGNMRLRLGHSFIPDLPNELNRSMPWSTAAFSVAALSMVGLPPTAGFFSKWYLALGTIEQSNWLFLGVLIASSLLNAVYFFRVLEKLYLKPRRKAAEEGERESDCSSRAVARNEAPASMLIPTLALACGILVLGIMNAWIVTNVIQPMIPGGL